jgi:hypothetical protein
MNQNNLLDVVNFMKKNKTFSDYKLINNFISNLNFTKYRFNNKQLGGADTPDQEAMPVLDPNMPAMAPDPNMPAMAPEPNMPAMAPEPNMPAMVPGVPPISPNPTNMGQPLAQLAQEPQEPQSDQMIIPEVEELTEEIDGFGKSQLELGVNDNADCVYKKITNSDGTQITQKICGQKIITMPDMFLPRPTFANSGINTYTIRKGTIMYHATVNKRGFDTREIRLGKDKLISFFTPNFRLASDKIEGCSIDKQKGFIHVFEVKTDIPDIFIKLPYDTDEDLNLDELKDKFCNANEYYKGVGFFYPKNEIELFNNSIFNQRTQEMHENLDDDSYYSEFALCAPNDYLTYLYSQKCMSLRKLSQPYRFDGKNYN